MPGGANRATHRLFFSRFSRNWPQFEAGLPFGLKLPLSLLDTGKTDASLWMDTPVRGYQCHNVSMYLQSALTSIVCKGYKTQRGLQHYKLCPICTNLHFCAQGEVLSPDTHSHTHGGKYRPYAVKCMHSSTKWQLNSRDRSMPLGELLLNLVISLWEGIKNCLVQVTPTGTLNVLHHCTPYHPGLNNLQCLIKISAANRLALSYISPKLKCLKWTCGKAVGIHVFTYPLQAANKLLN